MASPRQLATIFERCGLPGNKLVSIQLLHDVAGGRVDEGADVLSRLAGPAVGPDDPNVRGPMQIGIKLSF